MKYGRDYFTNRKTVNAIKKNIANNMITRKRVLGCGISAAQLLQWEKDGAVSCIKDGTRKLYNIRQLLSIISCK